MRGIYNNFSGYLASNNPNFFKNMFIQSKFSFFSKHILVVLLIFSSFSEWATPLPAVRREDETLSEFVKEHLSNEGFQGNEDTASFLSVDNSAPPGPNPWITQPETLKAIPKVKDQWKSWHCCRVCSYKKNYPDLDNIFASGGFKDPTLDGQPKPPPMTPSPPQESVPNMGPVKSNNAYGKSAPAENSGSDGGTLNSLIEETSNMRRSKEALLKFNIGGAIKKAASALSGAVKKASSTLSKVVSAVAGGAAAAVSGGAAAAVSAVAGASGGGGGGDGDGGEDGEEDKGLFDKMRSAASGLLDKAKEHGKFLRAKAQAFAAKMWERVKSKWNNVDIIKKGLPLYKKIIAPLRDKFPGIHTEILRPEPGNLVQHSDSSADITLHAKKFAAKNRIIKIPLTPKMTENIQRWGCCNICPGMESPFLSAAAEANFIERGMTLLKKSKVDSKANKKQKRLRKKGRASNPLETMFSNPSFIEQIDYANEYPLGPDNKPAEIDKGVLNSLPPCCNFCKEKYFPSTQFKYKVKLPPLPYNAYGVAGKKVANAEDGTVVDKVDHSIKPLYYQEGTGFLEVERTERLRHVDPTGIDDPEEETNNYVGEEDPNQISDESLIHKSRFRRRRFLGKVGKAIGNVAKAISSGVKKVASKVASGVKNVASKIASGVKAVAKVAGGALGGALGALGSQMAEKLAQSKEMLANQVGEHAMGVWNTVKNLPSNVVAKIKEKVPFLKEAEQKELEGSQVSINGQQQWNALAGNGIAKNLVFAQPVPPPPPSSPFPDADNPKEPNFCCHHCPRLAGESDGRWSFYKTPENNVDPYKNVRY